MSARRPAALALAAAALGVSLSACSSGPVTGSGTLDPSIARNTEAIDAAHSAAPHTTYTEAEILDYVHLACDADTPADGYEAALAWNLDHQAKTLADRNEGATDAAARAYCPKMYRALERYSAAQWAD